jgi:hypothetical protein
MSHPISPQHPAVVLRSHYVHVRALLTVAMIAVIGLTVAVVILATSIGGTPATHAAPAAPPVASTVDDAPGVRYDGGPDEGTRGVGTVRPPSHIRYDGGPEEGSVGPGR